MRNKLLIIGILSLLVSLMTGCHKEDKQITGLSMLSGGKTFAVVTGTAVDQFVLGKFPDAKLQYYNSPLDAAIAVRDGKADATAYDKPIVENIAAKNDGLVVLPELLNQDQFGFAVQLHNKELKNTIDSVVSELKANGTYDDMLKRWFPKHGSPAPMPDIKLTGNKGTLRLGIADSGEPIAYIDSSNKFTGFDIEITAYIAQKLDMQLEIVNMEFGALIPALQAGKIDMIASGISITEERAKKVLFSESYYDGGIAVIVASTPGASKGNTSGKPDKSTVSSFIQSLSDSFHNNMIVERRYLLIVDGLKVTVLISLLSVLFGTLLGAMVCFMRMSKNRFLCTIARVYISILRGTPVLVLLMLIFYVVFASVNIDPVIVAVIAFGMNFGAYVSEMFRTAIESVDKGQAEAGIAGGFTPFQTFIYIILPQAVRQVLPVYKGEFISLVKMTSVVGYIAVQDLTKASDIIRSRTFDAFFPLVMVAVLYFAMAYLLALVLDYIGLKTDPKRSRPKRTSMATA